MNLSGYVWLDLRSEEEFSRVPLLCAVELGVVGLVCADRQVEEGGTITFACTFRVLEGGVEYPTIEVMMKRR